MSWINDTLKQAQASDGEEYSIIVMGIDEFNEIETQIEAWGLQGIYSVCQSRVKLFNDDFTYRAHSTKYVFRFNRKLLIRRLERCEYRKKLRTDPLENELFKQAQKLIRMRETKVNLAFEDEIFDRMYAMAGQNFKRVDAAFERAEFDMEVRGQRDSRDVGRDGRESSENDDFFVETEIDGQLRFVFAQAEFCI